MAETRERRVVHSAVRALLAAVLDNAEGAETAFRAFSHELFPEQLERERAHDDLGAKVLKSVGEGPIPVVPVNDLGSAWGNRIRAHQAVPEPAASSESPKPRGPSWGLPNRSLRVGIKAPAKKDGA